jgi:hypothetical protein
MTFFIDKHRLESYSFKLFGFSLHDGFSAVPIHFFSFHFPFVIKSLTSCYSNLNTLPTFLVWFLMWSWRFWRQNFLPLNRVKSFINRDVRCPFCLGHLCRLSINLWYVLHLGVAKVHNLLLILFIRRVFINKLSLIHRFIKVVVILKYVGIAFINPGKRILIATCLHLVVLRQQV